MKVRLSEFSEDWVRLFHEEAHFLKTIFMMLLENGASQEEDYSAKVERTELTTSISMKLITPFVMEMEQLALAWFRK
ncbi:hypothetical protein J40TS1_35950 [Paenibacillus montaniterrae]|uniref:Uncharacterized protein n=1 Tax=Paenibacillus montaniterrae TaxID=429341 RepID=A0A919YQ19_9BACL|nr:hypothetical protein J40TS1_35950 [Paenibacillus montaniterrae]